ncbi:transposase, partial [Leptospira sp. id769339]|nr:transposase [Leptospira sp. id769339]
ANVFGLDIIVEEGERFCLSKDAFSSNEKTPGNGAVAIRRKGFSPKIYNKRTENWLQYSLQEILFKAKGIEQIPKVQSHSGYGLLNSPSIFSKAKKYERSELERYNAFWSDLNIKKFQRNRELEYQKTANKIWNWIQAGKKKGRQYTVIEVCDELEIHKITAMTILRKWLKLKLIARRRIGASGYDRRINFSIKPLKQELPFVLYSKFKTKSSKRVTINEK